ncbi:amino acid ABC transporter permease [Mesorhizobium sp. A623]
MTGDFPSLDKNLEKAVRKARARPAGVWMSPLDSVSAWQGGVILLALALSLGVAEAQTATAAGPGPFATLLMWMPFILRGFLMNLAMSFIAMILATIFGVLLGLMQISTNNWVRRISRFIMQIFRNTPWLVILFAIILLVPYQMRVGDHVFMISAWVKATVGFSLPVMANVSEIVRGAIRSIPDGQWESAESLAFTRRQTLWMIILPQCVKRMIPPWMNWYAILTLSTPIASILGVQEAVGNAQQAMEAAGAREGLLIPFYGTILLLFFLYIYPIARCTIWLERKYAVKL